MRECPTSFIGTIRELLRKTNVKSLERHQVTKSGLEEVVALEVGPLVEAQFGETKDSAQGL